MPKAIPASTRDQLYAAVALLVASVILYFGRTLLIPMLLAIFLSFILTPFVQGLQRRGIHRILAVGVVMTLALLTIGAVILTVTAQVNALIQELPGKKGHIIEKIRFVTGSGPSMLGTLSSLLEDINQNVQKPADPAGPQDPKTAIPVTVQPNPPSWLNLPALANSAQYILGFAALIIGLCGSILLRREDLRNRLTSLIGLAHITSTTRAMEEVTQRITRYLLVQVMLNGLFGLLFGVGLQLIGVEYAFLWGLLAAVLRFIPGLGTWMAAVIPVVISLATPGWWQPVLVLMLVALMGVLFNYVIEPIVFSRRTGLSIVSLVIMAAFWTWLWGLPGLVLATPISVCLLVLGSHIPMFHFLYVFLAETPVLDAELSFYQRLLVDDEDEVTFLLETYLKEHSLLDLGEKVLIPTLVHAQLDVSHQLLTDEELKRMIEMIHQLLDEMETENLQNSSSEVASGSKALLLGCASHDQREGLALSLMNYLLPKEVGAMEILGDRVTVGEIIQKVGHIKPSIVCIVSLAPKGQAQPRMRCKRLRTAFPDLPIIMALWGNHPDEERESSAFQDAGATKVTWTMTETLETVTPLLRVATHMQPQETLESSNGPTEDTIARNQTASSLVKATTKKNE